MTRFRTVKFKFFFQHNLFIHDRRTTSRSIMIRGRRRARHLHVACKFSEGAHALRVYVIAAP